jgi:uncharacterized protein YndB with AHSA1/START domain
MLAKKENKLMNPTTMDVVSEREIVIARTFDAPARIVFEAWTKPELVKRWWAPRSHGVEIASCEADVRVGGSYRYVMRRGGTDMAFSGAYTEVTPYTRLVYTNVFEPMAAAGDVIVTVTFEESSGKTRLTSHQLFPSKQVRDSTLATGMERGMRETMDQLEELLESLR